MAPQYHDPVCGMLVDPVSHRTEQAGGQEYHFCSDACQRRFRENPSAYLAT